MGFLAPKPAKSSQQSTATAENANKDYINSQYGGAVNTGNDATARTSALLTGQGDTQGANTGYQNYLQQAGYAPAFRQLSEGVTGQGAAAGLLNSGATAQALQTRGAELNQGYFNNYLQNLSGLSQQGLQAGGLIANVGQKSTSQSTGQSNGGSPGLLGTIGSAVGGVANIFSDRRLKHGIEKVGELEDGLGVYDFSYHGFNERVRGVMADEVAKLRPWALGPIKAGYATVDYGKL